MDKNKVMDILLMVFVVWMMAYGMTVCVFLYNPTHVTAIVSNYTLISGILLLMSFFVVDIVMEE